MDIFERVAAALWSQSQRQIVPNFCYRTWDKADAESRERFLALSRAAVAAVPTPGVSEIERLKWHIPDNIRWLSEQSARPDHVPCGAFTGTFLAEVADQYERLAALGRALADVLEPNANQPEAAMIHREDLVNDILAVHLVRPTNIPPSEFVMSKPNIQRLFDAYDRAVIVRYNQKRDEGSVDA